MMLCLKISTCVWMWLKVVGTETKVVGVEEEEEAAVAALTIRVHMVLEVGEVIGAVMMATRVGMTVLNEVAMRVVEKADTGVTMTEDMAMTGGVMNIGKEDAGIEPVATLMTRNSESLPQSPLLLDQG